MSPKKVALQIVEESIKELESAKGSLLSAIQKLQRASVIVNDEDKHLWCLIQLGDPKYTTPLSLFIKHLQEAQNSSTDDEEQLQQVHLDGLKELGLNYHSHYSNEELNIKQESRGGGYSNIGVIEACYADLVRTKKGNDTRWYKGYLINHINYVKKKAHELASDLYRQLKFSGTVSNCFDVMKDAVDDRLLDLNPEMAEQLMLAFKSTSSESEEEWSQALTSCRRLLEGLADELYPASKEKFKGRPVGQAQYVNRLWAFMEISIQSESNKDLAKAHIDFLGSWLEKANRLTNKGVHAKVEKIEAVKSVFHTYLVIADILDYLDRSAKKLSKPDINTASLDEIETLLDVKRDVAKAILKLRIQEGQLDLDLLSTVKGIGPKMLDKAKEVFEIAE